MLRICTLLFSVYLVVNSDDCLGDPEIYFMGEGIAEAVGTVLGLIPFGIGQMCQGAATLVSEPFKLCRRIKEDNADEKDHEEEINYMKTIVSKIEQFDNDIEYNFARMKDAALKINASVQLIYRAVHKYLLTNAKIEFDDFQRNLRSLNDRYLAYVKLVAADEEDYMDIKKIRFQKTCENINTSPVNLMVRIDHMVTDEQGIFNLAMTYYNYTDHSFIKYFNVLVGAVKMIMVARGTYEISRNIDKKGISYFAVNAMIMEMGEELLDKLEKLNLMRERQYFRNISTLFSGYFPINDARGYNSYLNRNYAFFRMEDSALHRKYVYSLEYEGPQDLDKSIITEPRFTMVYNSDYVSILRTVSWEKREIWKSHISNLLNTKFSSSAEDGSKMTKVILNDKLNVMILSGLETDVQRDQEDKMIKVYLDASAPNIKSKPLEKDSKLHNECKNKTEYIFVSYLTQGKKYDDFMEAIKQNLSTRENKKIGEKQEERQIKSSKFHEHCCSHFESGGNVEKATVDLAKCEQKLAEGIDLISEKIELFIANMSLNMYNLTETTEEMTGKKNALIKENAEKFLTKAGVSEEKEKFQREISGIIVEKKLRIPDLKTHILHYINEQIRHNVEAVASFEKDEQIGYAGGTRQKAAHITKDLQTHISQILDRKQPYIVRSQINSPFVNAIGSCKTKIEDIFNRLHKEKEDKAVILMNSIMQNEACCGTKHGESDYGLKITAIYQTKNDLTNNYNYPIRGFGQCKTNGKNNVQYTICYYKLAYGSKCIGSKSNIKEEKFT